MYQNLKDNMPTETETKNKYFVFSDESGSWHDSNDVYVRAWVILHEPSYGQLVDAINFIATDLESKEIKWRTLANNEKYWDIIGKFDFRIFLTVSSPKDINWETKYRVTRNFETQVQALDFGEINPTLVAVLKKKMFDDIRNVLFLNFYEKTHIENARNGIDRVLPNKDNLLIYRVDPPQMSKDGWKNLLETISPGVEIEFPKSQTNEGIQFADVIAGCVRSFLVSDGYVTQAGKFIKRFRSKLVARSRDNPNPNLIFYQEINDALKARSAQIWTI